MRRLYKLAGKYVPGKIERLQKIVRVHKSLGKHITHMRDSIISDILDGWSTGNRAIDFGVVACGGMYDREIIEHGYATLEERLNANDGKYLLVVQEALCYLEDGIIPLRSIYLAESRLAPLEFDVNKLLIGIPTRHRYTLYQELWRLDEDAIAERSFDANMIYVGPLRSRYSELGKTVLTQDEKAWYVPADAVASIYTYPWNTVALLNEHGIDAALLSDLKASFLRGSVISR